MAAYLKVVPILKTDDYVIPVDTSRLPNPVSSSITYNLIEQKDYLAKAKATINSNAGANNNASNSSKALYLSACGSMSRSGWLRAARCSLRLYWPGLSSIRRVKPDALINVI